MDNQKFQKKLQQHQRKREEYIQRKIERDKEKRNSTLSSAIMRVKEEARQDTWATSHANCFRFSPPPAESETHIRAKFEEFLKWRKFGAKVFTELIWKNGSRSDLVVCLNNGEVEIIEIAETESEKSLQAKEDKYPFPMRIVRCKDAV